MKENEKKAIKTIREKLNLRKLNPRRLYLVDDGALSMLLAHGRVWLTPRLARLPIWPIMTPFAIAASHGAAGIVSMDDLPQDWRDGYALGDIAPL